jgi:hypothetical protein
MVLLAGNASLSQPNAIVQFFGGYSMPLGDFRGNFGDTTLLPIGSPDTSSYLMSGGINYGISIKKPLTKSGQLMLTGTLIFNAFSQTKDFKDDNVKLRIGIFSLTLGAEWQFSSRKSKVNPFLGADINLNLFNGSLVSTSTTVTTSYSMQSTFRVGAGAGGGIDFAFHQNVGIVVGAKYTFSNIIGKSSSNQTNSQLYYLNDAPYTDNGANYKARDIQFLQLYGGVSFYFGK